MKLLKQGKREMVLIRTEQESDYEQVYKVVNEAFKNASHSDGNEPDLVNKLRKSKAFIPELSLVAIKNGKIAGHILFTKAYVNEHTVLALAPLSVLPDCQRQGVGLALIEAGHQIAKSLGYEFSVVLGHPEYYPKAGYVPAGLYGIKPPFPVADENFMALCLNGKGRRLDGIIRYDDAFGISQE